MRRQTFRWCLLFAVVLAFFAFVLWWASAAVRYGASRIVFRTAPTWRVWGTVRDAHTGAPVAWARIRDDPAGRQPHFETMSGLNGAYELLTLAEPHHLVVTVLGYRQKKIRVGRHWFLWTPRGSEQVDIALEPEPRAP